jgi:hypothetical protein
MSINNTYTTKKCYNTKRKYKFLYLILRLIYAAKFPRAMDNKYCSFV